MAQSKKIEKLLRALFHIAFGLFLISAMLEATTFSDYPLLLRLISPLRKVAWLLAAIKIGLQGIGELKSKSFRLQWFPLLFFAGLAISYYFCRSPHLLSFSLFILAAKGISFKNIARHAFLQQGITMLVTVSCCFMGWIKSIDITGADGVFCVSLGYNSANCLMLVGFQLILLYGYLRKDHLRWYHFLIMLGFAVLVYLPAQGRTGLGCILLAILAMALWRFKWMQFLLEKLRFLFKPFVAVLSVLFLAMAFLYPKGPLSEINRLSNERLRLTHEAIEEYGTTPFGQQIHWIGQRGKTLGEDSNYNYVDCSYAKAFMDYGAIPLILFLIAFYQQKDALYRKKDYLLLLLLLVIELYCFFDSFLIPPIYNTTIFLMKDTLYPLTKKEHRGKE